jgi:hypothetical protein
MKKERDVYEVEVAASLPEGTPDHCVPPGSQIKSRPKHAEHLCRGLPEMSICLEVMR